MGDGKQPKPRPFSTDVRYLQCPVCMVAATNLVEVAARKRAEGGRMGDEALIELVEKACDPYADQGEWIAKHDYVRATDKTLSLVAHDSHGKCNRECETIRQACEAVVGEYDTDVADALYRKSSAAELAELMCTGDALGAPCQRSQKQSQKKARKEADEIFEPISAEDFNMARVMAQMGDMGMGGQIFSRDQFGGLGQAEVGDSTGDNSAAFLEREAAAGEEEGGAWSALALLEGPWWVKLAVLAAGVSALLLVVLEDEEDDVEGEQPPAKPNHGANVKRE
jgi:hypothetical protein